MFGLVIAILILIAAIVCFASLGSKVKEYQKDYEAYGSGYADKARKLSTMRQMILAAGVVLFAALMILSCVTTVPTGHTGVPVTFGRVESYTLDSGVHFIKPWQTVVKMDNRVQKKTVDLMCFSADIQEVSMVYTINYQISKADAMTIYSSIGTDYYDTVVMPSIAEAVKIVAARYSAEELIGMRDELAQAIEADLANKLAPYHIDVVATSIEDMDFSDAFTDAVEAKQVAQQNKLRAETEAEQKVIEAEAAAEVRKVEADAAAYEILAQAEAEAEANKQLAASITDGLINYQYAQSWNGELPMFSSSGEGAMYPVFNMGDTVNPAPQN